MAKDEKGNLPWPDDVFDQRLISRKFTLSGACFRPPRRKNSHVGMKTDEVRILAFRIRKLPRKRACRAAALLRWSLRVFLFDGALQAADACLQLRDMRIRWRKCRTVDEIEVAACSKALRVLKCLAKPAHPQQQTDERNIDLLFVLQKTGTETIFGNRTANALDRGDGSAV